MLFRRREPLPLRKRLRHSVLPQGGWRRALRYFGKRVLRLSGSPHTVAMGFGVGIFVAWSPFFGLHYLLSAALSFVLRGNVLASILSTTIGNPLTIPAMWTLAFYVGEAILGENKLPPPSMAEEDVAGLSWSAFWEFARPVLVGSIPLGLVTGVISYFVVRFAVAAYQESRRQRLAQRRLDAAAPTAEA